MELLDYGQVSAHLRHYAQGNATIWLGTEYTTYGLYSIIPQVRLRRPHGILLVGLGAGDGVAGSHRCHLCRRSCWRTATPR